MDQIDPIVWAILLVILGLLLVIVEVLVPSGGVFGFLSFCAMVAGVGLAFYRSGTTAGFSLIVVTAVALPMVLAAAFRWLPQTPVGKRLLPEVPTSEDVLPDSEQRRLLRSLVGKSGTAKSLMLPSGAVSVEGRLIDAVSEGVPIEPGQLVRVIEVRGTRVVVRPIDEEDEPQQPAGDDLLSRPIDSLGIDPIDPLA